MSKLKSENFPVKPVGILGGGADRTAPDGTLPRAERVSRPQNAAGGAGTVHRPSPGGPGPTVGGSVPCPVRSSGAGPPDDHPQGGDPDPRGAEARRWLSRDGGASPGRVGF